MTSGFAGLQRYSGCGSTQASFDFLEAVTRLQVWTRTIAVPQLDDVLYGRRTADVSYEVVAVSAIWPPTLTTSSECSRFVSAEKSDNLSPADTC